MLIYSNIGVAAPSDAKELTWLVKHLIKSDKVIYKKGNRVGSFLFVQYNKLKNSAIFECQECERKFPYNIYSIKHKKNY